MPLGRAAAAKALDLPVARYRAKSRMPSDEAEAAIVPPVNRTRPRGQSILWRCPPVARGSIRRMSACRAGEASQARSRVSCENLYTMKYWRSPPCTAPRSTSPATWPGCIAAVCISSRRADLKASRLVAGTRRETTTAIGSSLMKVQRVNGEQRLPGLAHVYPEQLGVLNLSLVRTPQTSRRCHVEARAIVRSTSKRARGASDSALVRSRDRLACAI